MEAAADPICPYCEEQIQQNQPKAQAPCLTFFHTACFLYLRPQRNGHIDNCDACFTLFYPDDEEVEEEFVNDEGNVEDVNPSTRIRNLYDTNEKFRNLAKNLVKQKTVVIKAKSAVANLAKEKKNEIRNQLLAIKAQLQGLLEGKQGELRDSEEYKNYVKGKRRYEGLLNQLRRQYDCSQYALSTYLNDKTGFRRFSGLSMWAYSSGRFLRRPWRYHVPV
jgi:hypothetical protein